ncbi:uncharacterized protein [Muntiacus reevesi]|uniref:uncharacterized protein n=1 Tax=Muntiacus reevesi TaxID=9886 RepID=UPI0033076C72
MEERFSTVRDTQRGSQLHGEEKREEGDVGNLREKKESQRERGQSSQSEQLRRPGAWRVHTPQVGQGVLSPPGSSPSVSWVRSGSAVSVFSAPFIEEAVFDPLYIFASFVKNKQSQFQRCVHGLRILLIAAGGSQEDTDSYPGSACKTQCTHGKVLGRFLRFQKKSRLLPIKLTSINVELLEESKVFAEMAISGITSTVRKTLKKKKRKTLDTEKPEGTEPTDVNLDSGGVLEGHPV